MKLRTLKLRQSLLHDMDISERQEWVEKGWIDVYVELILASDPAKDPSSKHFHTLTKFVECSQCRNISMKEKPTTR